jgi:hypothetical protein
MELNNEHRTGAWLDSAVWMLYSRTTEMKVDTAHDMFFDLEDKSKLAKLLHVEEALYLWYRQIHWKFMNCDCYHWKNFQLASNTTVKLTEKT